MLPSIPFLFRIEIEKLEYEIQAFGLIDSKIFLTYLLADIYYLYIPVVNLIWNK